MACLPASLVILGVLCRSMSVNKDFKLQPKTYNENEKGLFIQGKLKLFNCLIIQTKIKLFNCHTGKNKMV